MHYAFMCRDERMQTMHSHYELLNEQAAARSFFLTENHLLYWLKSPNCLGYINIKLRNYITIQSNHFGNTGASQ